MALEPMFAWSDALDRREDPHEKYRVFAVPPEWHGYFYRQVLAEAFARVMCYGHPYSEALSYSMGRVIIRSIDDGAIELYGPIEPVPQARQRVEALMARLTDCDIPSHDDLLRIATDCGCTMERW